jgi:hypothetical protein
MSQQRTPESLTLADLPGVDPARFEEWKRLNRRARLATLLSPLVYLTGLITVPGIGGGIGWLLPVVFWFIYMFAFARPIANAERALATDLGVPAVLGLPTAGVSTKTRRVLKIVLLVWLAGIVLSVIVLVVKLTWPTNTPSVGSQLSTSALTSATPYAVRVEEYPAEYRAARVQEGFFAAQGIAPHVGRLFVPADFAPEAAPVVVISHEAWKQLFKGDVALLGRSVRLDGNYVQVVGIAPEGFRLPGTTDFWTPARMSK